MACIDVGHMTCIPAASVVLSGKYRCLVIVLGPLTKQQMFDELHAIVLRSVYKRRRCILPGFSVQLDMTFARGLSEVCEQPKLDAPQMCIILCTGMSS